MLIFALLLLYASETSIVQIEPAGNDSLHQKDSLAIMPEMKKVITDSWFSQDKLLHFAAGFAIPGYTYVYYVNRLNGDEQKGKIYAVSVTTILALGKEIYDKKKKGHFSWKDLVWGGLGLAVGYFVMIH